MRRIVPAFLLAALTAIAAAHPVAAQAPIMINPRADNGRTIDARIGMVLSLGLPNNAGTGFFWRAIADRNALAVGALRTVRTTPGGGAMVGYATTEIVTVRPLRAGLSDIRFILARPGGETAQDIRVRIEAR